VIDEAAYRRAMRQRTILCAIFLRKSEAVPNGRFSQLRGDLRSSAALVEDPYLVVDMRHHLREGLNGSMTVFSLWGGNSANFLILKFIAFSERSRRFLTNENLNSANHV
jgi:hypothetical protein